MIVKDVANGDVRQDGPGRTLPPEDLQQPNSVRIGKFAAEQRISWIQFSGDDTEIRDGCYHGWHFVRKPHIASSSRKVSAQEIARISAGSHLMHNAHELCLDILRYINQSQPGSSP